MATPHTHGGDINVCTDDDENLNTVPVEPEHIRVYDADGKNFPGQGIDLDWLESGGEIVVMDRAEDRMKFYTDILSNFCRWLNDNTDTFDPVIMAITLDTEMDPKLGDEQIVELVDAFLETRDAT